MARIKHWLEDVLLRILPIWQGQIGFACELMERSIVGLSGKFANIVSKFEQLTNDQERQRDEPSSDAKNIRKIIDDMKRHIHQGKESEELKRMQMLEAGIDTLIANYEARLQENQQRNNEIRNQVEEILVDLQFQDRVSQILKTVAKTQGQLHEVLSDKMQRVEQGSEDFDAEKWIEAMRNEYAMEDQYLIHDGKAKADSKQVDEITFF